MTVPRYTPQRPHIADMATPKRRKPNRNGRWLVFVIICAAIITLIILLVRACGRINPPENTPTPNSEESYTKTIEPTFTPTLPLVAPQITPLATSTMPPKFTATPSPTLTRIPTDIPMPFILKGKAEMFSSDLLRPDLSCDWLIIAGQVWDLQDSDITGDWITLSGSLGNFVVDISEKSGNAPRYGDSGYEFVIQNPRLTTVDTLWIQLFDANGNPLSNAYAVETSDSCQQNLILINFKQVR